MSETVPTYLTTKEVLAHLRVGRDALRSWRSDSERYGVFCPCINIARPPRVMYQWGTGRDNPYREIERLRVATMHRVKGLEFDRVLIVGVNDMVMPYKNALNRADDELAKAAAEVRERCLLYVSLTRAKKEVVLTSHGVPSKLLQGLQ